LAGEREGMQLCKVHEEECIVIAIEKRHKEGSICVPVRLMPGSNNGGYCKGEPLNKMADHELTRSHVHSDCSPAFELEHSCGGYLT
jgi:hypothetical protein